MMMENQKVLKYNSPLIDDQIAKTLWNHVEKSRKLLICRKHEFDMKSGTVGEVMLGRWMKSNTSTKSQDFENQAWIQWFKMAGT